MKHNRLLLTGIIALAALVVPFRANSQAPTNVRVINPVETKPAPNEIISLKSIQDYRDVCRDEGERTFFQTLPDGSTPPSQAQPFAVPAGKILVVTSLHWLGVNVTPNNLTYIHLSRVQGNVPKNVFFKGSNTVAIASAMSDSTGTAAGHVTIPSGFVVKSGVSLCASLHGASKGPFMEVILHGYLANDFVIRPVPRRLFVPPPPTKGGATQPAPTKK